MDYLRATAMPKLAFGVGAAVAGVFVVALGIAMTSVSSGLAVATTFLHAALWFWVAFAALASGALGWTADGSRPDRARTALRLEVGFWWGLAGLVAATWAELALGRVL